MTQTTSKCDPLNRLSVRFSLPLVHKLVKPLLPSVQVLQMVNSQQQLSLKECSKQSKNTYVLRESLT
jgi:hypothetical protein